MRSLFIIPVAALSLAACAEVRTQATDLGVSQEVQNACASAAAQEIAGLDEDTDFDAVMERLQDRGKACLIAAVQDVLTAQVISAPAAIAGEVVAADGEAAAAISE